MSPQSSILGCCTDCGELRYGEMEFGDELEPSQEAYPECGSPDYTVPAFERLRLLETIEGRTAIISFIDLSDFGDSIREIDKFLPSKPDPNDLALVIHSTEETGDS